MNAPELQEKLESLMVEYETHAPKVAVAKADYEKMQDLEEATVAVCSSAAEGTSEAEKKRGGFRHQRYLDWLSLLSVSRLEYLELKARESYLEIAIKGYISLLSFEKTSIDLHK